MIHRSNDITGQKTKQITCNNSHIVRPHEYKGLFWGRQRGYFESRRFPALQVLRHPVHRANDQSSFSTNHPVIRSSLHQQRQLSLPTKAVARILLITNRSDTHIDDMRTRDRWQTWWKHDVRDFGALNKWDCAFYSVLGPSKYTMQSYAPKRHLLRIPQSPVFIRNLNRLM